MRQCDAMAASSRRGLRIGIDGTCLGSRRGYGRYLRELLPPLLRLGEAHDFALILDRETSARLGPLPARTIEVATRASQADAASARGNRALGDLWAMGRAVARAELDVLFFPSVYSFFPVFRGPPLVVCMHDTIAERYGAVVFPSRRNRWMWNAKVALARRQASALLTVSEWSRRSLAEHFGIAPGKIHASPEAPAALFSPPDSAGACGDLLAKHGLSRDARYLIYVGGFNPHKNLPALIEAMERLGESERGRDLRLLLVGDYAGDTFHADVEALRQQISALGLDQRIRLLGFVPDPDLRHLYAGAIALVLPSLEEGFGLPAFEAAACGTPCVATQNSPLPQLLEGGGLFVDPGDRSALHAALERVIGDPALRDQMADSALRSARALSWDDTARSTLDVLEQVAKGGA